MDLGFEMFTDVLRLLVGGGFEDADNTTAGTRFCHEIHRVTVCELFHDETSVSFTFAVFSFSVAVDADSDVRPHFGKHFSPGGEHAYCGAHSHGAVVFSHRPWCIDEHGSEVDERPLGSVLLFASARVVDVHVCTRAVDLRNVTFKHVSGVVAAAGGVPPAADDVDDVGGAVATAGGFGELPYSFLNVDLFGGGCGVFEESYRAASLIGGDLESPNPTKFDLIRHGCFPTGRIEGVMVW